MAERLRRTSIREHARAGLGAELGHHQRRRHSFARDVAEQNRQTPLRQLDEIVVVAADSLRGLVEGEEIVPRHARQSVRQKPQLDLPRVFDVELPFQMLHHIGAQLNPLQCHAGHVGHRRQEFQILLAELFDGVVGAEFQSAQGPPRGRGEGRAHKRVDAVRRDRRRVDQIDLGLHIVAQAGFHLLETLADDRFAEPGVGSEPAEFRRLLDRLAVAVERNDKDALRLFEQPVQHGGDFRKQLRRRRCFRQFGADLEQRPQPHGRRGFQILLRGAAVHRISDRATIVIVLIVLKTEAEIANFDFVFVFDWLRRSTGLVQDRIHPGPVAPEVPQEVSTLLHGELGVVPADRLPAVVDGDIDGGELRGRVFLPAEHTPGWCGQIQRKGLRLRTTGWGMDQDERCQRSTPGRAMSERWDTVSRDGRARERFAKTHHAHETDENQENAPGERRFASILNTRCVALPRFGQAGFGQC